MKVFLYKPKKINQIKAILFGEKFCRKLMSFDEWSRCFTVEVTVYKPFEYCLNGRLEYQSQEFGLVLSNTDFE